MYIEVILSKYLNLNRWPKSGPLAPNGVLLVAQKWPVGKQGVNLVLLRVAILIMTNVIAQIANRIQKPSSGAGFFRRG